MNDVLEAAEPWAIEIVASVALTVWSVYLVPWLRQKNLGAFAERADLILNRAVQSALNQTKGVAPGIPVPLDKVTEVVSKAGAILRAGAPSTHKAVFDTLRDKVLARIEVADAAAGNLRLG